MGKMAHYIIYKFAFGHIQQQNQGKHLSVSLSIYIQSASVRLGIGGDYTEETITFPFIFTWNFIQSTSTLGEFYRWRSGDLKLRPSQDLSWSIFTDLRDLYSVLSNFKAQIIYKCVAK